MNGTKRQGNGIEKQFLCLFVITKELCKMDIKDLPYV